MEASPDLRAAAENASQGTGAPQEFERVLGPEEVQDPALRGLRARPGNVRVSRERKVAAADGPLGIDIGFRSKRNHERNRAAGSVV